MQAVPINYWAILGCGVASMVLGSIWYGPLFGKMWMRMVGMDRMEAAKREEMKKSMMKSYVITFIASLLTAWVLAHAIIFANAYMNTSGVSGGLKVAFISWLGFVAPVTVGVVLWEGKPWKLWTVSNAHQLVQLFMFAIILSNWM